MRGRKTTVEGLRELEAAFKQIGKLATNRNVVVRALTSGLKPMEQRAKDLAPVDEGGLKRGISTGRKLSKSQRKAMRRETRSHVEVYMGPAPSSKSVVQEFGGDGHRPHPYMRPAWEEKNDEALQIIAAELKTETQKAIDRQARKAARDVAKAKKAAQGG